MIFQSFGEAAAVLRLWVPAIFVLLRHIIFKFYILVYTLAIKYRFRKTIIRINIKNTYLYPLDIVLSAKRGFLRVSLPTENTNIVSTICSIIENQKGMKYFTSPRSLKSLKTL